MCDCKKKIEANLLERFKTDFPAGADHSAVIDGYGFAVTNNKVVLAPYHEVSRSLVVAKKTGGFAQKRSKIKMLFRFCPYCGESLIPADAELAKQEGGAA